ncbi:hypothetical protein IAI51_20270 [Pseudomonas sp. N40(2020)]|uniref:hypothetical protein n=1 Tax=Pseudomonas sp. N40(2020) TaxID=2767798 RepID=UPI001656FD93|nr:hypothetical protein [Pseudomonas sp. N40(2020)]MBC8998867.1 hypothetical protein [Pseudomonas sp. N40(2020)]
MPLVTSQEVQRIEFDLQRVPKEWLSSDYTRGTFRELFKRVLEHDGYQVSSTFHRFQSDGLMIQQKGFDQVFLLISQRSYDDSALRQYWKNWIKKRVLLNKHPSHDMDLLKKHLAENKVVYLLGDIQRQPSGSDHLIIIRDA